MFDAGIEEELAEGELDQSGSIKAYFYQSLSRVCEKRNTDASESSLAYIVNLLCQYVRADQFFEWNQETGYDLRPLALLYGEAVNAVDGQHRMSTLRRLGDVALFVSGLFGPSLARKPVGVDYYIDMGGGAYGWLSDNLAGRTNPPLDSVVFRELSERFGDFVNLLDEFADCSSLRSDKDLITLYEQWLCNKNPSVACKIREKGVAISHVDNHSRH
jgi:hypothetical protein